MKFVDETGQFSDKQEMFEDLYRYMQQKTGFDRPCSVHTVSDPKNAQNPLGKTAYYDPQNFKVVLYTDGRHIKDILRSFAHELIHHKQNCEGNLGSVNAPEGYAQTDNNLRKMELEAYKDGNINFRDWEDGKKSYLQEKIKKRGNKWIITTKDGSKTLGTHDSKNDAIKQLQTIEANKMTENIEEKDIGTLVDIFNMTYEKYKKTPTFDIYLALNDIAGAIDDVIQYSDKEDIITAKRIWQRTREIEQARVEAGLPVMDDEEDPFGTYDPKTGEDPMQKKFGNPFKPDSDNLRENKEWDGNNNESFDDWLSKERQIVHSERLGLKMNLDNLGKSTNKKRLAESMGLHEDVIDRFYNDEDK